jgi:hypothetical protein
MGDPPREEKKLMQQPSAIGKEKEVETRKNRRKREKEILRVAQGEEAGKCSVRL